jgi:hypothetical protein
MSEFRLGDVIDDHCIKCRRITNHSIVSIVAAKPAKVRCRTCYHDHDYRNEEAPPSKKDLKKQELYKQVLDAAVPGAVVDDVAIEVELEVEPDEEVDAEPDAEPEAESDVEPEAESEPSEKPKKGKARTKKA